MARIREIYNVKVSYTTGDPNNKSRIEAFETFLREKIEKQDYQVELSIYLDDTLSYYKTLTQRNLEELDILFYFWLPSNLLIL